ncbi:phospholipase/carboxylesterase family protein [Candidatus Pelagibacter sp. IMCC9063]|uniref:alpha/beta hydrolase n=1 Tax=Pelagibacter sp. (strain IMCC9063) TaxID=1002672 RepID=UPI000204684A|nr:dienelactone hydrolase family protein [Candidatus Pelagibacter sp. IMCC9063]AEA80988.1 phospholipase/carboxylesterase family protein [Candidatus Pelagibacter sp. IMCC9063]
MSLHFKKLNSNSTQAKKMVILSHGYGADCNDLLSIGEYWQKSLPDFCFIAPNAPTPCQINPSGFEWFDLMQTSQEKIIEEFQSSLQLLDLFINTQLKEQGLEKKDLYLMGFSQGTMMSLQLALSYKDPIAGILGYSGKVYDFNFLEKNILSQCPILLLHGNTDTVITLEEMYASYEFLKKKSLDIKYKVFENCGHSITPEGLSVGLEFLKLKVDL